MPEKNCCIGTPLKKYIHFEEEDAGRLDSITRPKLIPGFKPRFSDAPQQLGEHSGQVGASDSSDLINFGDPTSWKTVVVAVKFNLHQVGLDHYAWLIIHQCTMRRCLGRNSSSDIRIIQ